MGLLLEKIWPPAAGIAATIVACCFMPTPVEGMKEVAQAIVNTSAIAIGFLATSLSILYSIGKSRIMKDLEKLGRTSGIINYFIESMIIWFLLAVVSGVFLLIDFKLAAEIPRWGYNLLLAMWGILAWSVATLIRIVWIFRAILLSP